jgi:hypothetical protein
MPHCLFVGSRFQWNDDAEEAEEVRIETKRLVRFRLCPSDSCSKVKGGGCVSGYGDYIVDLNTFVDAYLEASREASEYQYEDDDKQEEQFDIETYTECIQYEFQENGDENNRRLEEGDEGNDGDEGSEEDEGEDEEEEAWYIGPYCAEQGGAVYLGFFTDDECTTFADSRGGGSTFESMTGDALPYSATNILGSECVSCLDRQGQANDDNGQDDDNTLDVCQEVYAAAGKCETEFPTSIVDEPNKNACNYISGVKIVRNDGIVAHVVFSQSNGTATFFIFFFALMCVTLAFYVHFLRTKLGVKDNVLL